jgi:Putative beta-lactamase-inhibitor-like, PepSY-like
MKKVIPFIFSMALLASASFSSFAQLRKIPAEVTNRFTEKYPMATNVEWKDKLSGFSASFTLDNLSYTAAFTNKGIWETTEQEIEESDLPETIKDSYEKSKYAEWTIGKMDKIEMPDNVIQYRVEAIKSDIQKRNLYFSSTGRLLRDKLTL